MKILKQLTSEAWLIGGLALMAILGLAFMSQLVGRPKMLFGQSLASIPPSLFPTMVLLAMAALAVGFIYLNRNELLSDESTVFDEGALQRVVLLFGVMFFYALTMAVLGFFISTALSMMGVAWLAGNRNKVQIVLVALISPVLLYLLATRGLAVSLPELSVIEFFYAGIFEGGEAATTDLEGASE